MEYHKGAVKEALKNDSRGLEWCFRLELGLGHSSIESLLKSPIGFTEVYSKCEAGKLASIKRKSSPSLKKVDVENNLWQD